MTQTHRQTNIDMLTSRPGDLWPFNAISSQSVCDASCGSISHPCRLNRCMTYRCVASDLGDLLSTCRDDAVFVLWCQSCRAAAAAVSAVVVVDDDDDDDVTEHDQDSLLQTEMTASRALWRSSRLLINAGNDFKASSRDTAAAANNKTSGTDEACWEQGARDRDAAWLAATPTTRVELALINALRRIFYYYLVQNRFYIGGRTRPMRFLVYFAARCHQTLSLSAYQSLDSSDRNLWKYLSSFLLDVMDIKFIYLRNECSTIHTCYVQW